VTALAIHPGALGDVLLAVPALRALRAAGAPLTVAAQPRIGALLVALGVANHAAAFDTLGLETLFGDAPLDPGAPLARLLADATRVVCWFGARDADFTRRLCALAPGATVAPATTTTMPVWRHLVQTVGGHGDRAPIACPPGLRDEACATLRTRGWDGHARLVVVHPGAGGLAKRWPAAGFAEVVERVDAALVVHQGPADGEAVRELLARLRRPAMSLIDPPLPMLAGVLSLACAYIGNDSGISHLAATVGAPSLILFTEAALPWVPWSLTARCVTVTTSTVVDTEREVVTAALSAWL
jgi:ADP-heptose:LPS heptosyltransferase